MPLSFFVVRRTMCDSLLEGAVVMCVARGVSFLPPILGIFCFFFGGWCASCALIFRNVVRTKTKCKRKLTLCLF
jgi:hypothetical protein